MAARQMVGGRRAHQMWSRFCGGRWRALLSRWHSAESEAQGSPPSRNEGLVRMKPLLMFLLLSGS